MTSIGKHSIKRQRIGRTFDANGHARPKSDNHENAEVLGVEVKTFSGGHVRFMSKAELQRYGDVVFVHYDWTSARRGQGYRRGHGSGARTLTHPCSPEAATLAYNNQGGDPKQN